MSNKNTKNKNFQNKYYATVRQDLIQMILPYQIKSVLDVGCGLGANLSYVRKFFPECITNGIELRKDIFSAVSKNKDVNKIFFGDAMSLLRRIKSKYDLIILSHVIEHVFDHETFLRLCIARLKPNGLLLVAIPNIRHLSVLLPLIFNDSFKYENCGILDSTHCRFFTYKTCERLFTNLGLKIIKFNPDCYKGYFYLANQCSFGIFKKYFAYAFNFLLKVKQK